MICGVVGGGFCVLYLYFFYFLVLFLCACNSPGIFFFLINKLKYQMFFIFCGSRKIRISGLKCWFRSVEKLRIVDSSEHLGRVRI